jgi:chromosome segregation ATPase
MNKVANKLGLIAEANEETILAAINKMEDDSKKMEDKLAKMQDALKSKQDECAELEAKMDEFKKQVEDAKNEAKKAEDEAKKSEAKTMVENFVKIGKIKNESTEKWIAKAVVDFDGVKNLLEELPTNGKATTITINEVSNDAELTMVAARAMQQVRNNLKIN